MSTTNIRILKTRRAVSEKTTFSIFTEYSGNIEKIGKQKAVVVVWNSPKETGEEKYLSGPEAWDGYLSLINCFKYLPSHFE